MTSCFVVMGFNTKKIPNTNIEVDLNAVYSNIIKPVILNKELTSIHGENRFRADEVYTTQNITKTFIEGIFKADIVIADITTLNQNAIYELGLRHAMRPKSTIILCDNHTAKINFFDISHLPQIRYDSDKVNELDEVVRVKDILTEYITSAINSDERFIDSPVFENNLYTIVERNNSMEESNNISIETSQNSFMDLARIAKKFKDAEEYVTAENLYKELLEKGYVDDEILAGYLLSAYKKDEKSLDNLREAQRKINTYLDINNTTYHKILGIYGAIFLRIFYITNDKRDLLSAINYYRLGMNFEDNNIYCARNYCATLLKIVSVETETEVLKEHYYTAKYTAKIILGSLENLIRKSSMYDDIWLQSNREELLYISGIIETLSDKVYGETKRQSNTINEGRKLLREDLERIKLKLMD